MVKPRDLATKIVKDGSKFLNDRMGRLIADLGLQTVEIRREELENLMIAIFNELPKKLPHRTWPDIDEKYILAAGARAYNRLYQDVTTNYGKSLNLNSVTKIDSVSPNSLRFIQPKGYRREFFTKYKSIWIRQINVVLRKHKLPKLQTAEQYVRSKGDPVTKERPIGAWGDVSGAEEVILRNLDQRLHVDDTTIASLRAAYLLHSADTFFGGYGLPTKPGDFFDKLLITYSPEFIGEKAIIAAAKSGVHMVMGHVSLQADSTTDTRNLEPMLIKVLTEMLEQRALQGMLSQAAADETSQEFLQFLAKNYFVQIDGAVVNLDTFKKYAKRAQSGKVYLDRSKGKRARTPREKYIYELEKRSDAYDKKDGATYAIKKAQNIKNRLNAMLRTSDWAAVKARMRSKGAPPAKDQPLRLQSGTLAESFFIEDVTITPRRKDVSIRYEYQRVPYGTFEPGGKQGSKQRDPHNLIEMPIREMAVQLFMQQGYKLFQAARVNIRRPISG